MKIALLGGKGLLGRRLSPLLTAEGHQVVMASRSATGPGERRADFATGEGVAEAIGDTEVVVHLVSNVAKQRETDIEGTRRLLDAVDSQHLIYVSIVGVDRHPYRYYRTKLAVEEMIRGSGVSHTILRATQFHDFLAYVLKAACRPPVAFVPKRFVFQPIETSEVAVRIAELVSTRPPGLQPDVAGPTVHNADYLARTFMEARGKERPVINLPLFGTTARAFEQGVHTNPDRAVGVVTWEDYLAGGDSTRDGRIEPRAYGE